MARTGGGENGGRSLRAWRALCTPRTALFLCALVVLGAGLGLRDPWPPDEPRYALVAHGMASARGDWLVPHVAGYVYPDKPPVFFWLVAALEVVTGSLRIAFLLPSLLAALLTVLLIHDLARDLHGERAAIGTGCVLLATSQFTLQAHLGQIDMVLTGFTTVGLVGLLRHVTRGPQWGWYTAAWAAMAAGVLTKGVGFLPALVLVPYGWGRIRGWSHLSRWQGSAVPWAVGPLIFLAVLGAWLLAVAHRASGDPTLTGYLEDILVRHAATRYSSPWHHREGPLYYLLEVIPALWQPALLLLIWALPPLARRLRSGDSRFLLPLGFVLLGLLFFSVSPGKRGVYLTPLTPALALLLGPFLPELLRRRSVQVSAGVASAVISAALLAGAALVGTVAPATLERLAVRHELDPRPLVIAIGLVGAIAAAATARRWGRWGVGSLAVLVGGGWILFGTLGGPLFDGARSGREFAERIERALPRGAQLAVVQWAPELLLQLEVPARTFGHRRRDRDEELAEAIAWLRSGRDRESRAGRRLAGPVPILEKRFDCTAGVAVGWRHRKPWVVVSRAQLQSGQGTAAPEAPGSRRGNRR